MTAVQAFWLTEFTEPPNKRHALKQRSYMTAALRRHRTLQCRPQEKLLCTGAWVSRCRCAAATGVSSTSRIQKPKQSLTLEAFVTIFSGAASPTSTSSFFSLSSSSLCMLLATAASQKSGAPYRRLPQNLWGLAIRRQSSRVWVLGAMVALKQHQSRDLGPENELQTARGCGLTMDGQIPCPKPATVN